MRFEFDRDKSWEVKRKHGVSLREAEEIFDQAYLVDQKSDDPEQFRAIGWCHWSPLFRHLRDQARFRG
jgi:uncharacterized DUF497 family protein